MSKGFLASRARFVVARSAVAICVVGLGLLATGPSGGRAAASAVAEPWTPSQAPMPTVLPSGEPPQSMTLNSTSCSSALFCVAVGTVQDGEDNHFPVAETYENGSWLPSVLPTPANAAIDGADATLMSVSCPTDGMCAAAGVYYDYNSAAGVNYQSGLLEVFSSGQWTASEAALPGGSDSGLVNLNAVSCPDAAVCVAVGSVWNSGSLGLSYTLTSGSWQMQAFPVPSGYGSGGGLDITGVSCPNDISCVAVGWYQDTAYDTYGLILSLESGVWSAAPAPMPADVVAPIEGETHQTFGSLNAIDCPSLGACVAGGFYVDGTGPDGNITQPLLLQQQPGGWTAIEGPVPANSQADTLADIQGVYCPVGQGCVATGYYWLNFTAQVESGMILTESNGTWTVAPAPLPSQPATLSVYAAGVREKSAIAVAGSVGSESSLAGVSCGTDGFCAAVGTHGDAALSETGGFSSLPQVTGVSPNGGTVAGGTAVTIRGDHFGPDSVAYVGGVATATSYISATQLRVATPISAAVDTVDITVRTGGVTTRANQADRFSYHGEGFLLLPGSANGLAVGANGTAWVMGTNPVAGGYGLYHWGGTGWVRVAGGGVSIAVGPDGNPWVVNSAHHIFAP